MKRLILKSFISLLVATVACSVFGMERPARPLPAVPGQVPPLPPRPIRQPQEQQQIPQYYTLQGQPVPAHYPNTQASRNRAPHMQAMLNYNAEVTGRDPQKPVTVSDYFLNLEKRKRRHRNLCGGFANCLA